MSQIKQHRPAGGGGRPDRGVRHTRQRILDATEDLITTRGVDGFTMDAVADAAGVSRSTLYRHWPQLPELLSDVLQHIGERIDAATAPPEGGGTTQQCVVADALLIGRVLRNDRWRELLSSLGAAAHHNADVAAVYDRSAQKCRNAVADFVRNGQAAGDLPSSLDSEWVTDLLVAPILTNALIYHQPMTDEQITAHVEATFAAVRCPATPPAPSRGA